MKPHAKRTADTLTNCEDIKKNGAIYTPENLAEYIAQRLMDYASKDKEVLNGERIHIIDPAVGDGILLERLAEAILQRRNLKRKKVVISGVDLSRKAITDSKERLIRLPENNVKIHLLNTNALSPTKNTSLDSGWEEIYNETDFVCRGEHLWCKPNVPSPIRSRLKHSHEKLFWFVKDADKYYFDEKPWEKPLTQTTKERVTRNKETDGVFCDNIKLSATSCYRAGWGEKYLENAKNTIEHSWRIIPVGEKQQGFEGCIERPKSEHIAPFPSKLIIPYIQSLCPDNGIVLDPFLGSGTTMRICMENQRDCIGIELNEKYIKYSKKRLNWGNGINIEYGEKSSQGLSVKEKR